MNSRIVKKGDYLARRDAVVDTLWYIAEGRVIAQRGGIKLLLRAGDFIGIADYANGLHSFDYYAQENTKLVAFCQPQMLIQSNFFAAKPENCRALALSINHYLRDLYVYMNSICNRSEEIYKFVTEYYMTYQQLCQELSVEINPLAAMNEISEGVSMGYNHKCLYQYHKGTYAQLADKESAQNLSDKLVIPGYIIHAGIDFNDVIQSVEYIEAVVEEYNQILINANGEDLLCRFNSLYSLIGENHSSASKIMKSMVNICEQAAETDTSLVEARIEELKNSNKKFDETDVTNKPSDTVASLLSDSMKQIVDLVGFEENSKKEFLQLVKQYKNMIGVNPSEEEFKNLRKNIERYFYQLYLYALEYSIEKTDTPIILKMFLYFGYLDEELAGITNACELYDLAQTYSGRPNKGLFTGYEWLKAIYTNRRDPSINEFEQTFEQFINEQADNGRIPADKLKLFLQDRGQMVMFELQNMFRNASRICSGRITDFCPIFSENQVLRSPKEDFLNPDSVLEARDAIRKIDYTLFYRETVFVYDKKDNIHDIIHVEILPDIILLPVVGSRGCMWQEVCGRNRMTSARMMLPCFDIDKLDKALLRMFAEYRWEMCKRVQGARWNDVTDPSLTSLYYDYLQFYRKNSAISLEQKEKIKIGLQKARNVYKEYFINDYDDYIRYEAEGSPRLIRPSRMILYSQCPFSTEIRQKLSSNPIFAEVNDKLRIKYGQQNHRLENLRKRFVSKGKDVPPELERELEFYK